MSRRVLAPVFSNATAAKAFWVTSSFGVATVLAGRLGVRMVGFARSETDLLYSANVVLAD
jgi:hypothetical protein